MKRTVAIKFGFPVLALIFSLGWPTEGRSQGPLLVPAPGSPVTVGPGSGEVLLADLNGDGHLDLITKHLLSRTVAVRLADGKGQFAPVAETALTFGYSPGAITLGDVNNDRTLDLGVASRDGDGEHVHVFLGDGRSGFNSASGSPITVNSSFRFYKPSLRFVDIDEDGKLDIVTANGRRNSIEILFGNGRGGFSRGRSVTLEPGQDRYSFALGDVDGDGHLDAVTVSSAEARGESSRLAIKRGDGKGFFTDTPRSPAPIPSFCRIAEGRRT
jgi:hypothetical protein